MVNALREVAADRRVRWHERRIAAAATPRRQLHAAWHWLVSELAILTRQGEAEDVQAVLGWVTDRATQLNERSRS